LLSCLFSPLCWLPWGLLAIVCGTLGLREVRADPGQSGRGLAIAGIALGALQLMLVLLMGIVTAVWIGAAFLSRGS
jgi:hypothetical protein